MKYALCAFALATMGSTSAYGQDQIAESCSGTETIQVGENATRVVPYTLTFSADLAAGYYCYADCRPQQTYRIDDRTSNQINSPTSMPAPRYVAFYMTEKLRFSPTIKSPPLLR
jgi:hypothetical protein